MALNKQKVIKAAEKLVGRGRIEAAITEYRKVLKQSPNDTNTLNRVGDLYARLNRLGEAIDLFRRTARHFGDEGFFVKAIAIYKKIIRLDPTQIDAYEQLADLYSRQGLVSEARGQYQVVADYYAKHEDLDSALGIHHKLVELEPENPSHRLHLAELLQRLERLDDAMEQYRSIASLMLTHGRAEEATEVCLRALAINADDLSFVVSAVQELKEAGHPDLAQRLLDTAVEENPEARAVAALVESPAPAGDEVVPPGDKAADAAVAAEKPAEEASAVEAPRDEAAVEPAATDEAVPAPGDGESEGVLVLDLDEVVPPLPEAIDEVAEAVEAAGQAVEEPAAAPDALEELEFEIELEDVPESSAAEPATAEAEPAEAVTEPAAAEAPVEEVPATAAASESAMDGGVPAAAPPAARPDELLAESEVLQRYGLADKAIERLEQAVAIDGQHLDAYGRLIDMLLGAGRLLKVAELANRVAEVAAEIGAPDTFDEIRTRLRAEGFTVVEGRIRPPEEAVEGTSEPAAAAPAAAPAPTTDAGAVPVGVSWLDDAPSDGGEGLSTETLFEGEDEFFDLAGELEEELRIEDEIAVSEVSEPAEQSIEDIVEGFRRGMDETLSAEDYDTHYNLGIAYREMGLVDEAIGEFQLASKDARYLVDCCSLLAYCFTEKGFPELAVKWYLRGLETTTLTEDERLGLAYELGELYMSVGDTEAARKRFVEIYGINSNYRDVVAKLEELGQD